MSTVPFRVICTQRKNQLQKALALRMGMLSNMAMQTGPRGRQRMRICGSSARLRWASSNSHTPDRSIWCKTAIDEVALGMPPQIQFDQERCAISIVKATSVRDPIGCPLALSLLALSRGMRPLLDFLSIRTTRQRKAGNKFHGLELCSCCAFCVYGVIQSELGEQQKASNPPGL